MQTMIFLLAYYIAWSAGDGLPHYPDWFLQTPEEKGIVYTVGYARAYATYDSAADSAARDARHQLNLTLSAKVIGERLFQTLSDGQIVYQGEIFKEQPLHDVTPVYLDTVRVSGMVLVLAASRRPSGPVLSITRPLNASPPTWITSLPDRGDATYAVGISRLYYYEENSWTEAERQARQELAYSVYTDQRLLLRGTRTTTSAVTASATSVQLKNAQVIARWRSDTTCFVLMRTEGGQVLE